jgi:hypothetical protein
MGFAVGTTQGASSTSNVLDFVARALATTEEPIYFSEDDEEGMPQVIPNFGSFTQQGNGKGIGTAQPRNFNGEFLYNVNSYNDIQKQINFMKNQMLVQQNLYFQAGKCLRSFTYAVTGRVSEAACTLVQVLDISYASTIFLYKQLEHCVSEITPFCKKVRESHLLKIIKDNLTFKIEPAQELLAHSLGVEEEVLFRREPLNLEEPIVRTTSSKRPLYIKV